MYTPDSWVIIKITQENQPPLYKVLAGWSGGYLHGDSWRMNSGIESWAEEEEDMEFYGYSGSTYRCHKSAERLSTMCAGVLSELQALHPNRISQISLRDFIKEWNPEAAREESSRP